MYTTTEEILWEDEFINIEIEFSTNKSGPEIEIDRINGKACSHLKRNFEELIQDAIEKRWDKWWAESQMENPKRRSGQVF